MLVWSVPKLSYLKGITAYDHTYLKIDKLYKYHVLGILLMPWSSCYYTCFERVYVWKEEREDMHSTQEHMVWVGKHVMKLRCICGW